MVLKYTCRKIGRYAGGTGIEIVWEADGFIKARWAANGALEMFRVNMRGVWWLTTVQRMQTDTGKVIYQLVNMP